FVLPEEGQAGWPVVIGGPFDGDSKDTEVELDGKPRRVIAESPRHATIDAPEDQTGNSTLTVKEQGKTATGTYRNARVKLRAGKVALTKGESTQLNVKVEGLDGISTPAILRLTTVGTVRMEGGNEQFRMIFPQDVAQDGTYELDRTIT